MRSVELKKSTRSEKKLAAVITNGTSKKTVNFGCAGMDDYTKTHDQDQRKRYLARHKKEDWTDPNKAGFWARWILWNKPTLNASIQDVKQRFGINVKKK